MPEPFDFQGCPTSKLIVTFPNEPAGREARAMLDDRAGEELGLMPMGALENYLHGTRAADMAADAPLLYSRYRIPFGEAHSRTQRLSEYFGSMTGAIAAAEPDYPLQFFGLGTNFSPGGAHSDYLDLMGVTDAHTAATPVKGQGRSIAILDSGVEAGASVQWSLYFDMEHDPVNAAAAQDQDGHGTAMALLAQAVAPAAELHVVRIVDGPHDPSVFGLMGGLFVASADIGADVISMSLGFDTAHYPCPNCGGTGWMRSYALETTVAQAAARRNGAGRRPVVLAATGNDGYDTEIRSPAAYAAILAVGSVDKTRDRSAFSNYNRGDLQSHHVMAPGGKGTMTALTEHCGSASVGSCAGTSPATAYAAALMALLWSDPRYERLDRETFLRKVQTHHCSRKSGQTLAEYGCGVLKWLPASTVPGDEAEEDADDIEFTEDGLVVGDVFVPKHV